MKLPKHILKALQKLNGSGFEAFVVGGSVRDMIMGKTPADYDIATNALPQQTAECFKNYKVIETGIKHGTVTVLIDGENIEITTYRVDGNYIDNRHPENVSFTASIQEDLARRDFTMNAIAYSPEKGFVDPLGGKSDIKNGIIRCVGEPDKRFSEDGLRILRALRFASQTGFDIDGDTARSIIKNKNLIKNLSAERVFSELKKLLCGDLAHKVIKDYKQVVEVFIPEIIPMVGFEQNTKYHHLSVFDHTLEALKNSEKNEVIRLAVFLHDIGKPAAFYADADGTAHFKGHAGIGAEMAKTILKRLKSDNDTLETVCEIIRLHSIKLLTDTEIKMFVSEHGFELTRLLLKMKKADASAKAPEYRNPPEISGAKQLIDEIEKSSKPLFLKDISINGNDLINLGISGKKVGEILHNLLRLVILEEIENSREALINKAEDFLENEKER